MANNDDDIKVGINIVQPTEEKLTLLGSLKLKVPNKVRGAKQNKKETAKKGVEKATKTAKTKATKPKVKENKDNAEIEIDI